MTKSLTKQWREGTLPRGYYYCKLYYNNFEPRIQECVKSRFDSKSCIPMSCGCEGEEVLEPVPSYDEYNDLIQQNVNQESAIETYIERIHELEEQISNGTWFTQKSHNELLNKIEQLEKRLEIATKALKVYANCKPTEWMTCVTADNALKRMEGVK